MAPAGASLTALALLSRPAQTPRWPLTQTRRSDRALGWLLSLSDGQLCAMVAAAFWIFAATNKILVRGTLLAVTQAPFLATPQTYGLQYVLMLPALAFVHWAAYRVGLPQGRKVRALALQVALMLFLAVFARLALDIAHGLLKYGAFNFADLRQVSSAWLGLRTHDASGGGAQLMASPLIMISTGLDILFQYLIALALTAGVLGWKRYHAAAAASAALMLEAERARGMALRRQLDPHALFNTLNAVAAAIRPTPNTAIAMIAALGDLLRETLEQDRELSTVDEEFTLAGRYLSLYALRYPDRLRFAIDEPVGCGQWLIPTFLLQPLVENAALHGVESGAQHVDVHLSATMGEERMRIAIENTVCDDASLPSPADSPGIGLRNTWNRLRAHYGPQFELTWERPSIDRVRLVLVLPLDNLGFGAG